jgi:hypothetical protein
MGGAIACQLKAGSLMDRPYVYCTRETYTMGIFRLLYPSVIKLLPMMRHTCQKEYHMLTAAMKLEEKI